MDRVSLVSLQKAEDRVTDLVYLFRGKKRAWWWCNRLVPAHKVMMHRYRVDTLEMTLRRLNATPFT